MNNRARISAGVFPATWPGRLIAILITTAIAVVALFFIVVALIAAAALAAVVVARFWWVSRKLRAQTEAGVIEGSYSVESGELSAPDPSRTGAGDAANAARQNSPDKRK